MTSDPHEEREMRDLRARYEALHEKKIRADQAMRATEEQIVRLRERALEDYGTDDLDELERRLAVMIEENRKRRQDYREHLDRIEARLESVQGQYDAIDGGRP